MLNRLTFAWACRKRAVSLTNRMLDTVVSCSGMVDLADRCGAVAFGEWLKSADGRHALDSIESRLVSALAAVNAARGRKDEAP
jgi:hypothetical protein